MPRIIGVDDLISAVGKGNDSSVKRLTVCVSLSTNLGHGRCQWQWLQQSDWSWGDSGCTSGSSSPGLVEVDKIAATAFK